MSEFNNLISMLNDKNDIILSQQTKIDELQAKYDELNNRAIGIALDQMTTAKLNYELQVRIDWAIGSLKLVNHALLYEHIDHIINLLDRTTNEQ